MKLQFDKNLEYQHQAIASIVDLFRGQTPIQTNFTVSHNKRQIGIYDSTNGIGNRLEIDEDDILKNLQEIQLRNGLPQTKSLKAGIYNFDVEMETGTGKTYVYLRTILELHKNTDFLNLLLLFQVSPLRKGFTNHYKLQRNISMIYMIIQFITIFSMTVLS
jgi:type III restriction enzyme